MLHVDRNDYYGGIDAALSLQDAETWVKVVNDGKRSAKIVGGYMLTIWFRTIPFG